MSVPLHCTALLWLLLQLTEVKAAEKMLWAHVKTLTAELAVCRKG